MEASDALRQPSTRRASLVAGFFILSIWLFIGIIWPFRPTESFLTTPQPVFFNVDGSFSLGGILFFVVGLTMTEAFALLVISSMSTRQTIVMNAIDFEAPTIKTIFHYVLMLRDKGWNEGQILARIKRDQLFLLRTPRGDISAAELVAQNGNGTRGPAPPPQGSQPQLPAGGMASALRQPPPTTVDDALKGKLIEAIMSSTSKANFTADIMLKREIELAPGVTANLGGTINFGSRAQELPAPSTPSALATPPNGDEAFNKPAPIDEPRPDNTTLLRSHLMPQDVLPEGVEAELRAKTQAANPPGNTSTKK